jgi:hypothetical protein
MPFPNTRQIPRGLAERFAPVIADTFGSVVELRHPDQTATRDPATGRTVFTEAAPYYVGPARVQGSAPGPDSETPAGKQTATSGYLVAVPYDVVEARIGDLVRVLSGGDDPAGAGLWLKVNGTWTADLLLQRNLRCDLYVPAPKATK